MPFFCYRWKDDKNTHFGPIQAADPAALVERLRVIRSTIIKAEWPNDFYVDYWEIQDPKNGYLYPPKPGSGVEIWRFDPLNGRRLTRVE